MNSAIVIESWKLPAFERRLSAANYSYTIGEGLTQDLLTITVHTEPAHGGLEPLHEVVRSANNDAADSLGTWH